MTFGHKTTSLLPNEKRQYLVACVQGSERAPKTAKQAAGCFGCQMAPRPGIPTVNGSVERPSNLI